MISRRDFIVTLSVLLFVLRTVAAAFVRRTTTHSLSVQSSNSIPQSASPVTEKRDEPITISPCQLNRDPASYNHKLIQITGFISHGFEDFSLLDPSCWSWPPVWLEYGGKTASGTMYCCGVTAKRTRPEPLLVEHIAIELTDDERFHQFDQLVQRRPDSIVHATIVGRFFSGEQIKYANSVAWGGYGHMGCCSLLAIERVVSVDTQDRTDLDYRATADQPNIDKAGCGYKILAEMPPYDAAIKVQEKAERGEDDWVFSDPQRVANDAMARVLGVSESSIAGMKVVRQTQGRFVYQWQRRGEKAGYMIVVSRPYWLTFFAKDPQRIGWVVVGAFKSSCGGTNSVTRIQ
jgi:hypothetical protein